MVLALWQRYHSFSRPSAPTPSLLLAEERGRSLQGDSPVESYLIFCGLVCRVRAVQWLG